jgi:hypothetical protein
MPKSKKSSTSKIGRNASSGQFVVVKPAVGSKLKAGQIREAVRKVNEAQGAKK